MYFLRESKFVLGTQITVSAFVLDKAHALHVIENAFLEVERIDNKYSRFKDSSALSAFNKKLNVWQSIDDEFLYLIKFGERIKERTNGAFDLSVKSILDGWGYDKNYSLQESKSGQLGDIEIDKNNRIKISAEIDLGGIGKGYAIDRMANVLGVLNNFCIDAGGDIFAKGKMDNDNKWKIVFEHPTDLNLGIGEVFVDGFALASSSPARRKWNDRHHLIDTKTCLPAKNMLSVYTQCESALIADAYSTALFVMGFDNAKLALNRLPVEAMLININGDAIKSKGFKGDLYANA